MPVRVGEHEQEIKAQQHTEQKDTNADDLNPVRHHINTYCTTIIAKVLAYLGM